MSVSIVTCWYRLTGEEIGFNHISDGFDDDATAPVPQSDFQTHAWTRQRWEGRLAVLHNGVVIEVPTAERMTWS